MGLGTWITFNVGNNTRLRDSRTAIVKEFLDLGGTLIDSSPMYGSAEAVVGYANAKLDKPKKLFSATKIWTSSGAEGIEQMKESQKLWGIKIFDLMQVHNLDGWRSHLKTLAAMKAKGELRYFGVTTSHGRRHDELMEIMKTQPLDFIQLTYNMRDRRAEEKILDLAQERKIAVIANRPLDGGDLMSEYEKKPLPQWAADFDCKNWAQFFLKFVVSHPAITCAIPATSKLEHLRENMGAGRGRLPDAATRLKMIQYLASL